MPLTIVAQIRTKPEHAATVQAALQALIPTTRAEPGCLRYDLHADLTEAGNFLFYETWETRDLWQRHMQAPHLRAYGEKTAGLIESFTLFEMQKID